MKITTDGSSDQRKTPTDGGVIIDAKVKPSLKQFFLFLCLRPMFHSRYSRQHRRMSLPLIMPFPHPQQIYLAVLQVKVALPSQIPL